MTVKMDSKWLSLATVSILGQTPSENRSTDNAYSKVERFYDAHVEFYEHRYSASRDRNEFVHSNI